jgi:hypothetical protein
MLIPDNFCYSQNNLQDFIDCPRRFELRHLLKFDWPAEETRSLQEFEEWMVRGNAFHRYVQGYLNGIPDAIILRSISDPILSKWMNSFFALSSKFGNSVNWLPEQSFNTKLNSASFTAILDAVMVENGQTLHIFDWKTSTKLPRIKTLTERVQTLLYPVILDQNRKRFPQISNAKYIIKMTYWFILFPDRPISFEFDANQIKQNAEKVNNIVASINTCKQDRFPLTQDNVKCKFCNYRSFCGRGTVAGNQTDWDALEINPSLQTLSLDNIEEVEF